MTRSREAHIVSMFDTFNRYDVDAFVAHYSEDAVLHDVAIGVTFTGRAEIAGFMRTWLAASPESHITVGEPIVAGERGSVTWRGWGKLTGDFAHIPGAVAGSEVDQRAVTVVRFDADGLIAEQSDYYDKFSLLQQMGILPTA